MQVSEMRFCKKSNELQCLTNFTTLQIKNLSTSESLLFRIDRSQLRCYGKVSRMPQEQLPKQTLYPEVNGKRPIRQPGTRHLDYIENLGWNHLRLHPSKI